MRSLRQGWVGLGNRTGVALAPVTLTQKPTGPAATAADPGSALLHGTTGGRRPIILLLGVKIEIKLGIRRPADSSCSEASISLEQL